MLLVPSPIVLVIVLAIDFCPLESDKRNVFKAADNPMIKPKIDNDLEHDHDWRQNEEHWKTLNNPWPQRGEVRAAEAGAC
jgi:hypothetical protein